MSRALSLLFLGLLALSFASCATDDQPKDPNKVSTIPWNRPEKWEGQGPLGGFSPNSQ
jgi:hypothetical protein